MGDRIEVGETHRLLPVAVLAAAPELLNELQRSEFIILAMVNVMMDE